MYNLILIDDEPMALEQLAMAFDWEELGFCLVKCFSSGQSAIEYIRENPVDALITDIKMPGITGLEIAKFCYEEYPNIGVVLFTAHRDFEYAKLGIQYNVVEYLLKPLNDDALLEAMQKLRWHLSNQQRVIDRPSDFSNSMITNEAISYIKEHFSENITVEDVARHVLISPKYFGAYFKKSYGKNFVEYLREIRMNAAAELLKDEQLTISAVAEMVGYKSATHFYDFFQNRFGLTPAQYRKKIFSQNGRRMDNNGE